jgi:hypothetical protein
MATAELELPQISQTSPEDLAIKSRTHWVMSLFRDINNMGPIEIRSQLGYHDQRWPILKRCTPYPLGNLISYETDLSAVGEGMSFGKDTERTPKIEHVKYALDQAAELKTIYGDEGFCVLMPLTGMDDLARVESIMRTVMPVHFPFKDMAQQFTTGAETRIRLSQLGDDKKIARGVAQILAGAAELALAKARKEYDTLIEMMGNAAIGKVPAIANPTPWHEWLCEQLGVKVPRRINKMEEGAGDTSLLQAVLEQNRIIQQQLAERPAQASRSRKRPQRLPVVRPAEPVTTEG